ncbi:30S ribosomal protein S8 [bacterium (Candidatus Howlettbacteria) CG_4_10_14_0_8_um_filter_40_9]|nr:MAG: 30S ribosomal protein S8 [bacterium (Candidatus Howlettbacteria) CG_4_10_14_0_8_um_filter_40_9]
MITDPIADMLARIRNAILAKKEEVSFPSAKLKLSVLNVLKEEGYIEDFVEAADGLFKNVTVKLRYDNKKPAISVIERISRPGRRVYSKKTEIPAVLSGHGIVIISTPKGVMTGKKAKTQSLGGELLCKVY